MFFEGSLHDAGEPDYDQFSVRIPESQLSSLLAGFRHSRQATRSQLLFQLSRELLQSVGVVLSPYSMEVKS